MTMFDPNHFLIVMNKMSGGRNEKYDFSSLSLTNGETLERIHPLHGKRFRAQCSNYIGHCQKWKCKRMTVDRKKNFGGGGVD